MLKKNDKIVIIITLRKEGDEDNKITRKPATPTRVPDFLHKTLPREGNILLVRLYSVLPSRGKCKIKGGRNMFKISLKVARELSGYTVEDVAKYCGVSISNLSKIEIDSGWIQFSLMQKLTNLYGVPLDLIYFGTEVDCIEHNRLGNILVT